MMYRNYRKNSKIYGKIGNQYFYQFLEISYGDKKEHWKIQYDVPKQSTLWLLWTDEWREIPTWWIERVNNGKIKYKKFKK